MKFTTKKGKTETLGIKLLANEIKFISRVEFRVEGSRSEKFTFTWEERFLGFKSTNPNGRLGVYNFIHRLEPYKQDKRCNVLGPDPYARSNASGSTVKTVKSGGGSAAGAVLGVLIFLSVCFLGCFCVLCPARRNACMAKCCPCSKGGDTTKV